MTTKDWICLGLIVLTALAFYCNGFYAGVYRCKRMYDSLVDEPENFRGEGQEGVNFVDAKEKILAKAGPRRDAKLGISSRELKGDFGEN